MRFSRFIIALVVFSIIFAIPSLYAVEKEKNDSSAITDSNDYFGGYVEEFVAIEVIPEIVHSEKPIYPDSLKKAGVSGKVWVKALVGKDGKVIEAKLGKTSGVRALDDSAVAAVLKTKFKPALQRGKPINCWVTYPVEFKLEK